MVTMATKRDYLRGARGRAIGFRQGDCRRLSQAGDQVPSRQEPGRRRSHRPLQGGRRGLRGALRRRKAVPLRPLRPRRLSRAPGGGHQFTDVNDIFEAFGDIFGDSAFRRSVRRSRGRRVNKGGDVRADVTLDLLEAARGVTKTVEFERHEVCADCQGSGAKPGSTRREVQLLRRPRPGGPIDRHLPHADHLPRLPRGRLDRSRIPAASAAATGYVLTAREARRADSRRRRRPDARRGSPARASPAPAAARAATATASSRVKEHPLFQREGQHLIVRVPVTYSQAALGATLEVPTLDGREELKIPAGTQSGEVFRLRGGACPARAAARSATCWCR